MRVKQTNKNPVTMNRDPLGNLNPDSHNVRYKINKNTYLTSNNKLNLYLYI